MFDLSLSNSKDFGDMLRFLPSGVVVQKEPITLKAMANLYGIKLNLLERLIKSPFKPLKSSSGSDLIIMYKLDDYLSGFLQDPNRSRLYYCDPILQHISICRHFLSLLNHDGAYREP